MARGNQIARQWTIIKALDGRSKGVTIAELSRDLNCHPRTIHRDLRDLENAGFPIFNDLIEGVGHWQFVDGYRSSLPTPFSLTELMSLYLSRDLLHALEGTFFYESIQNLIGKIRAQLGAKLTRFLDCAEQAFAAGPGPTGHYRQRKDLLHLLNEACLERETVRFKYYSRKHESTTRKVDPYKVYFYQGTLYLIGYDHLRKDIRMFVLDRIQLLRKAGERFEAKAGFDLQEYLRHSFGVMTEELVAASVLVEPGIARFVAEKTWHPSQEIQKNPDGSMVFHFRVAGTTELKNWLLGLGPLARALEP